MKTKPLAIAIFIIVIAIALVIYSRVGDQPESNTPEAPRQTGQTEQREASRPESRSSSRLGSSAEPGDWDEQIDVYLADDSISNKQAVLGLLAISLKQSAPLDARQDALEHALNLVEDEDFEIILKAIDSGKDAFPSPLAQVILDDTYNRPRDIHLATCIRIMRAGYSDLIEEAVEQLAFFTDEDHGSNIEAWETAVERHLKKEGDTQ